MKLKKLGLNILCGASVLALFACGDDVMNIENGDSFTTVESIKDADCSKDNEGAMVFVKKEGTMYACTDSEWVAINDSKAIDYRCKAKDLKDSSGYTIICDGDTIGVVKNTNKTNVDSLYKAIMKNISKENSCRIDSSKSKSTGVMKYTVVCDGKTIGSINPNADELACRIDTSWVDTKKKVQNVTIACGKGKSTLELPISVESENLSKEYKKTVVARMPMILNEGFELSQGGLGRRVLIDEYEISQGNSSRRAVSRDQDINFDELWTDLNAMVLDKAELVVMELDENYNATGKNFVSDLTMMPKADFLKIYDKYTYTSNDYLAYLLNGNINVTNMISSRAQIRVTAVASNEGNPTFMTFNAIVDLDNSDTIVVDFLTDYKAARTKNLIDNGSDFKKASAKANSELAEVFGLGKNFESFETYLPDSYERNEFFAVSAWPALLFRYGIDFNYTYSSFKDVFAKNGNFNKAVKINYENIEKSKFIVDFFADLSLRLDETAIKYKFVQNVLKSAYKLPSCDINQKDYYMTQVKEGSYKIFECYKKEENWYPANVNNLDYEGLSSSFLSECNAENDGKIEGFVVGEDRYTFICENTGDDDYGWSYSNDDVCEGMKNGDYVRMPFDGHYSYFRCVENKETNKMTAEWVSYVEVALQKPCNSKTKDTLYVVDDEFFVCNGQEYVRALEDDIGYQYYSNFVSRQAGECNKKKVGTVVAIYDTPQRKADVICKADDDGEYYWFQASPYEKAFGLCDDDVEKQYKVYKYNKCELFDRSTKTCMAYVKCETDARDGWIEANDYDIKLNTACVHSMVSNVVKGDNGIDYVCTEEKIASSSSYSWDVYDVEARCNEQLEVESCVDADGECYVYNSYYACSTETEKWEKAVDYKEWCTQKHGACNYENYSNGIGDCDDFPFTNYYIMCMCDDGEDGDCSWSDQH